MQLSAQLAAVSASCDRRSAGREPRRYLLHPRGAKYTRAAAGIWSANDAVRQAERALAEQAEFSYKRMVTDQNAGGPARKVGAGVTPERA